MDRIKTDMDRIKTDSHGVKSAVHLLSNQLDLISRINIENVCLAVINRYSASVESSELVSTAYDILDQVINGGFVIRISKLKILCESLLKENTESSSNFINQQMRAGSASSEASPKLPEEPATSAS